MVYQLLGSEVLYSTSFNVMFMSWAKDAMSTNLCLLSHSTCTVRIIHFLLANNITRYSIVRSMHMWHTIYSTKVIITQMQFVDDFFLSCLLDQTVFRLQETAYPE